MTPPLDARPPAPTSQLLPVPPTDEEKYLYLGRQHRWFIGARTVAAVAAAASLALFSNISLSMWLFWPSISIFIGYVFLTHYTTSRRSRVTRQEHDRLVELWRRDSYPSVDVFLPSAGEDLDVLENTYRAVAALEYPGHVRVLVLDDSARSEVRRLSGAYGFDYLVRDNRGHLKKAGNLKFGYDQSDGDYIVIFDADFSPRPDFILELAPYLEDPRVGIVQSPQFFDTDRRLAWLQRNAGSVQESFYRWAQTSRDALGAPICVGTCAVYRRSALDESGGFAQIGHSEDVHTGVNLMKAGFRTIYVPVIVAKGLCPDRLSSFISQQYRWCAGSMSLLVDRAFHDSPLTYRQRLCFFTGFGYYISTAVGVFALALPTLIMLWAYPDRVALSNFFWVLPTLALYPFMALMHKSSWSPAVLRVYAISSFSHALAIWHVLRGRPAEWVPTGAERKTSMTSTVTRIMIVWLGATNAVMITGTVRFLQQGRSIVDVAPVFGYAALAAYIWVPLAVMAFQQRSVKPRQVTVRAPRRHPSLTASMAHAGGASLAFEPDAVAD